MLECTLRAPWPMPTLESCLTAESAWMAVVPQPEAQLTVHAAGCCLGGRGSV